MEPNVLPLAAPNWDQAHPLLSFQHFAQGIHEQAQAVILQDKNHAEMIFFLKLDDNGHIVCWHGKDRDQQAAWVRSHVHEHYIYGVIHICEAWVHIAKSPNDHTLRQIQDGEMKVSQLRPEHRQETLSVMAQSRDGYAHAWMDEILHTEAGAVRLGGCREIDDLQGRFGKLFG